MKRISKEIVLLLHEKIIKDTGGKSGILNDSLLESAIFAPFQTFDGKDLYPDILEKAARLCYGLIRNHAFVDGNKRIGIMVMLNFLYCNQKPIKCNDDELVEIGLAIANGKADYETLQNFIKGHL